MTKTEITSKNLLIKRLPDDFTDESVHSVKSRMTQVYQYNIGLLNDAISKTTDSKFTIRFALHKDLFIRSILGLKESATSELSKKIASIPVEENNYQQLAEIALEKVQKTLERYMSIHKYKWERGLDYQLYNIEIINDAADWYHFFSEKGKEIGEWEIPVENEEI